MTRATSCSETKTKFLERWARFSPDGRFVAYMSNESGRGEIYVRPFIDGGGGSNSGQWQVSTAGGISPVWRADGSELYYLAPDGTLMAVPIRVQGTELLPGAPVVLFPTRIVGGGEDAQTGRQYDVAPGGRFLINTVLESAATPITLVMNWNGAAKK
jgi:Tol biopolymer transport system component